MEAVAGIEFLAEKTGAAVDQQRLFFIAISRHRKANFEGRPGAKNDGISGGQRAGKSARRGDMNRRSAGSRVDRHKNVITIPDDTGDLMHSDASAWIGVFANAQAQPDAGQSVLSVDLLDRSRQVLICVVKHDPIMIEYRRRYLLILREDLGCLFEIRGSQDRTARRKAHKHPENPEYREIHRLFPPSRNERKKAQAPR